MKVIFCSTMFTDIENDLKKSKNPLTVSGHKFQESLLKGLKYHCNDFTVINIPRIRRYPDYDKICIFEEPFYLSGECVGLSVGVINLFCINYVVQFFNVYFCLRNLIKGNTSNKVVICTFNTHLSQSLAMLLVKHCCRNVILCDVIGDLHGEYGIKTNTKGLKSFLISVIGNFQDYLAKKFDKFVFLTEYMATALTVEQDRFVVVEGFAPKLDFPLTTNEDVSKKVIFYAGSLLSDYGIEHLLRAFSLIKFSDYRLLIAGSGEEVSLIKKYVNKDERISFLGMITPKEVAKYQSKATVLISPRQSIGNFVKYSFPSKTMECLASGKPFIAHRLPCDPPEYESVIQYANDDSDEALCNKILEICEKTQEERALIGKKGIEFIKNQKNPQIMTKKIIDMWEKLYYEN